MSGQVVSHVSGAVAHVVFDHPERRNALTDAMMTQAIELARALDADPKVRVVVVSGAGDKAFVSGKDINEIRAAGAPRPDPSQTEPGLVMYAAFRNIAKPTIARIRGFCFGGGAALASACDLRICSDDAQFSIPAGRLGVGYRAELARWIVEAVGPANAKEMLLTARRYDAKDALRIGFVHHVVPADQLVAFTDAYAEGIADNAPLAVKTAKAVINQVSHGIHNADLALCDALVKACTQSEDLAEGRRAFLQKRRPNFTGK